MSGIFAVRIKELQGGKAGRWRFCSLYKSWPRTETVCPKSLQRAPLHNTNSFSFRSLSADAFPEKAKNETKSYSQTVVKSVYTSVKKDPLRF